MLDRMRAVVQDRYGGPEVLHLADVPRPVPGPGMVLIRVKASTVSQTDAHMRRAKPYFWRLILGLRRPTRWPVLGVDLAGVVEEVGPGVDEFKVGDEVFGLMRWSGAHTDYVCVTEGSPIAHKPSSLSFEEAAAVSDGAMQALETLRRGEVKRATNVVVYGGSGSLGSAAIQIAKHMGAH